MLRFPNEFNQEEMVNFYGKPNVGNGPSRDFEAERLTRVFFPWATVLAWDTSTEVKSARVNRACAETLRKTLSEIWDAHGRDQQAIERAGMHLYGGAYEFRRKRGSLGLSTHAYGCAIDFDPLRNGLGNKKYSMPRLVVDIFKANGAVWGGDFSRIDAMHFQFARIK